MGKKVEKEKPLINVIVRTHRRKELFMKCMKSIADQDYERKLVHVAADDGITAEYVKIAIGEGLVDFYYRVDAGMLREPARVFDRLLKRGLCTRRDHWRASYNLYLNYLMGNIPSGWIFIVDDDKELPDNNIVTRISKVLVNDNIMAVGQYGMKSKTVPEDAWWKKLPFRRGQIDMSCIVFNVKHRDVATFDAHKASDWRVANYLAPALELKWIKEPFVVAENDGLFGRPE